MGSSPAVVASKAFEVRMQRVAFSKISAAFAGKAVGPGGQGGHGADRAASHRRKMYLAVQHGLRLVQRGAGRC
eukprot:5432673-Prymnesium_polylepis.1